MANKILLRRDTSSNWSLVNPVLSNGEIGLETDTEMFKIGNGVGPWNERQYYANAQGIAEQYAALLLQKVEEASDHADRAESHVAAAGASVDAAFNWRNQAEDQAELALNYANNAAGWAANAQEIVNNVPVTLDANLLPVLQDEDSDSRNLLDALYTNPVGEMPHVRITYGTNPGLGGIHTVGWHRSGEGVTTAAYNDEYLGTIPHPPWCQVTFGTQREGRVELDVSTTGALYMVQMKIFVEDAWTSLYPANSTWGLGWGTSIYGEENPDAYLLRTKTPGEVETAAAFAMGNNPWFTLEKTIVGVFTHVQPWVYVPVDTASARQFFTNIYVTKLN